MPPEFPRQLRTATWATLAGQCGRLIDDAMPFT
jgi:hypothetical protein